MIIIDKKHFIELHADDGKIIISKAIIIDEETGEEKPEVMSEIVCLGINDSTDNYYEINIGEESL